MNKVLLALFIFFLDSLSVFSQKSVAFTFDDLPFVSYRHNNLNFRSQKTKKLLATLQNEKVPAIGFVNEMKLYNGNMLQEQEIDLLRLWLQHGNELGNHTFSHIDYHAVSLSTFSADLVKGEKVAKELSKEFARDYKYFRHPFLHSGQTKEKNDSLKLLLKQLNYLEAPVSIDNSDYLFAVAYDSALSVQDTVLTKKIGEDYINYMERKLLFYEQQSFKLFGRNIHHILLLHANALNADYLSHLIGMFKKHNYTFSTLTEALKDPAYQTPVIKFSNWGISWLDRWALSAGKEGTFFSGDPSSPDYILKLAKATRE